MWPTIAEVQTSYGPLGIHPYGLFIVLAFSAAFIAIHLRAPRVGIHPDRLIGGYISAFVGGMLGGRILYAIAVDWERTVSDPASLFSFAGFAVYGGLIGGALGVGAFVALSKLPVWKVADLALPAVVLAMGVGRLGCFCAGCCHGSVAAIGEHPTGLLPGWITTGQLWWSGTFPYLTNEVHGGVGRLQDVPLYPTQLWDFFGNVSLAIALLWQWPRRRFDGQSAALALILQPPLRIFVESFRADERGYVWTWEVSEAFAKSLPPGLAQAGDQLGTHVVGITTSQGIGLAMMVLGVVIYAVRRNTVRDTAALPEVSAEDGDLLEELT
ncbi:MAG: prolipoprotein diacylglyceryl transferase [Alphaproteobacteria bacterium]|nr:prolipoprotein diacylglyceryl transferase [Alphaproteobacteria bacterium]